MASSNTLKVLEHCQISPPPGSVSSTILPLTFLDIPWLLFSPNQPLFFYDFPHHRFTQEILSNLKHSLSHTLQHFFILAGNLIVPPQPSKPHLSYSEGDSVSLIIAECHGNFSALSSHDPRNAQPFHQLVPRLSEPGEASFTEKYPLLAVQMTIFPGCGVCLGFALRKVAGDCRTLDNFLKTWASICRSPHLVLLSQNLASHDRALIQDPCGLEQVFLKQWWGLKSLWNQEAALLLLHSEYVNGSIIDEMQRATFLMGPTEIERIKGWMTTRSIEIFGPTRLYLSPYVVTCAFVWVCWTKTHLPPVSSIIKTSQYFGFNAGGIHRLKCSVSNTYVGNCIGFGRSMVTRDQLMGENGMLYAAKAIGDTIKELDREMLGRANGWILDWNELIGSDTNLVITGSPKVASYQLDFGWGRPRKIEEISTDKTRAISLLESKDVVRGMEVGLSLPKPKMDLFATLYREGLKLLY